MRHWWEYLEMYYGQGSKWFGSKKYDVISYSIILYIRLSVYVCIWLLSVQCIYIYIYIIHYTWNNLSLSIYIYAIMDEYGWFTYLFPLFSYPQISKHGTKISDFNSFQGWRWRYWRWRGATAGREKLGPPWPSLTLRSPRKSMFQMIEIYWNILKLETFSRLIKKMMKFISQVLQD